MALERAAFALAEQGELALMLIGLALTAIGGLLGIWLRRGSTAELTRSVHFLWWGFVWALGRGALPAIWLLTPQATWAGLFWLLMLAGFTGALLIGLAVGVLSHARSVNAYGDGRRAWMGIVPIANLVLMCKPPLHTPVPAPDRMLIQFAVMMGFLMIVGGNIAGQSIDRQIDHSVALAETDPDMQRAYTRAVLRREGVGGVLRLVAAGVSEQRLSEELTLLRAEADGARLVYVYRLEGPDAELSPEGLAETAQDTCADADVAALIGAGASIEYRFLDADQRVLGGVVVDQASCTV